MPPSSNNIFALLPPPGNLAASNPVIIFFMNCFHDIRFSPRAGAILLFAAPRSSVQFTPPIRSNMNYPPGSQRRLTSRPAATVLSSKSAPTRSRLTSPSSATDRPPSTGSRPMRSVKLSATPRSSSGRNQGQIRVADQTAVVFSSGFTLAASDREVVLFDLGRCATAGDAAVWLPKNAP